MVLLLLWMLVITIAINAKIGNLEGVNFWTICCSRLLHHVQKTLKNKWGTYFELGDYVVVGIYY
jgi:hypothetical protein